MLSAACARKLATLGLARYLGTGPAGALPGYVEDMPPAPDAALCVYGLPGFAPNEPTIAYVTPEVQVIVRHPGDDTGQARPGWTLAEQVRRALHGTGRQVWAAGSVDELHVLWCNANSSAPVSLGPDDDHRPRWSVSFQLETWEAPA